jgi:ABC-type taurine transport system substrate-binding protein
MKLSKMLASAAAALVALTSAATAGPIAMARGDVIVPPPSGQAIQVHYRRYRHQYRAYRHVDPGAAAVGAAAAGLLSLGATAAMGRRCGYYGCYQPWAPPGPYYYGGRYYDGW